MLKVKMLDTGIFFYDVWSTIAFDGRQTQDPTVTQSKPTIAQPLITETKWQCPDVIYLMRMGTQNLPEFESPEEIGASSSFSCPTSLVLCTRLSLLFPSHYPEAISFFRYWLNVTFKGSAKSTLKSCSHALLFNISRFLIKRKSPHKIVDTTEKKALDIDWYDAFSTVSHGSLFYCIYQQNHRLAQYAGQLLKLLLISFLKTATFSKNYSIAMNFLAKKKFNYLFTRTSQKTCTKRGSFRHGKILSSRPTSASFNFPKNGSK